MLGGQQRAQQRYERQVMERMMERSMMEETTGCETRMVDSAMSGWVVEGRKKSFLAPPRSVAHSPSLSHPSRDLTSDDGHARDRSAHIRFARGQDEDESLDMHQTFDVKLPFDTDEDLSETPRSLYSATGHTSDRDFIEENRIAAVQASRRPRSASTRQELSEPRAQPAWKVKRIISNMLSKSEASNLTTMDLSHTRIGNESLKLLCSAAFSGRFSSLKLTNCGLSADFPQSCLDCWEDHGKECKVEECFLGVNPSMSVAMDVLAKWIGNNSFLRVLDLQLNRIGDEGCRHLASAIAVNRGIEAMNLQGNCMTRSGLAALVEALTGQGDKSSLKEIFLGFNPIGDGGVEVLWDIFCGVADTNLETLCLCKCDITEKGGSLIAEAAESGACPLTRLDLVSCSIVANRWWSEMITRATTRFPSQCRQD